MGALDIIFSVFLLAFSLTISLFFTIPFVGTLVRYRANYTPKGLQLDQEGGVQPHVGPVVTGYWDMLMRVRRIEGFKGLYKGLMPSLLSTTALTIFAGVLMGASLANPHTPGRYSVPESGSLLLIVYSGFVTLLAIPFTILTNRAITTPRNLSWFDPRLAWQVLLTPAERRRPWTLYLIPGLLGTQLVHILYVILILHNLRRLVLPSLSTLEPSSGVPIDLSFLRFAVYFAIVLLSVAVLCPLEVVATRLSLQRSHHSGSAEFSALPQEEVNVEDDGVEFSGRDEDVVGLRSEEDPYMGLTDCAKRIINEEGVGVLYRAWWVTFLAAFGGALA